MTWAVIFAMSREGWSVMFWVAFLAGVVRGILDALEER